MKYLILVFMVAISLKALAHGEDKLGPNGGYIRMPGSYHTEVVPDGPAKFKIFFLDIAWKTQPLNNSSIEVSYKGNKSAKAQCEAKERNFFSCTLPKGIDLTKSGKLVVISQHEKQKGNEVTYNLPLKLEIVDDGHGGHH